MIDYRHMPTDASPMRRADRAKAATCLLVAAFLLEACGMQLRSPLAPVGGPPPTFVPTTSDVRATRVIDLRDGLAKPAAFTAASEVLSQHYAIDASDPNAGFLMTKWQASLTRDGAPDLRYRTRLIIRFLGDDWKQTSVRADANWKRGDEWDIGFDSKLLDDVTAELRTRIGKIQGEGIDASSLISHRPALRTSVARYVSGAVSCCLESRR